MITIENEASVDEAKQLTEEERHSVLEICYVLGVGRTARYFGCGIRTIDVAVLARKDQRQVTIAKFRARIGPGACFCPAATGDA